MSLEYCTPSDVPKEVSQYDGSVAQMGVGKSGKIGYLQLELQNDPEKKMPSTAANAISLVA